MRGIDAEKAAIRALVLKQLGVDPTQPRTFAGQAGTANMAAALLRLPCSLAPQNDLQDPTTGDFFFMADYDPIDGDALIA